MECAPTDTRAMQEIFVAEPFAACLLTIDKAYKTHAEIYFPISLHSVQKAFHFRSLIAVLLFLSRKKFHFQDDFRVRPSY